jgi:L-threonylcarbamoyladenylate synthase
MKVVDRAYVEAHKDEIIEAIQSRAIFIYPTDTIYGLGGRADFDEVVWKIRDIKQRDTRPISVLAPSKEWILENCEVRREDLDTYLPGPYTLILKRKGVRGVSYEVNPNDDTLGVRIPDHWFTDVIQEAGVPFVTTSVNVSGTSHMEKLEDVPQHILDQVDYVVYEGEKVGKPSEKVSLL